MLFYIFFIISAPAWAQEYVPGTPGAEWSLEETLIVKSKLYAIFNGRGYEANNQLGIAGTSWIDVPNAAKMLRLGFHDCVKYQDGTGGCDGCLNWEGVGFRFDDSPNQFNYENIAETNNNGLEKAVMVLEGIYTDPQFPRVSLTDKGPFNLYFTLTCAVKKCIILQFDTSQGKG